MYGFKYTTLAILSWFYEDSAKYILIGKVYYIYRSFVFLSASLDLSLYFCSFDIPYRAVTLLNRLGNE